MICPRCQASIPDGSRFCNQCGFAQTDHVLARSPILGDEERRVRFRREARNHLVPAAPRVSEERAAAVDQRDAAPLAQRGPQVARRLADEKTG